MRGSFAQRRCFRPGYAANLISSWIPALNGVEEKLKAGAKVADIGCGLGASTILMAGAYPNSTFIGFDYHVLCEKYSSERVSAKACRAEDVRRGLLAIALRASGGKFRTTRF